VLFDAHNHLQDERFGGDLSAVILRAKEAGVGRMMSCATGARGDWDRLRAIADCNPEIVLISLGIHPWYLEASDRAWKARLELALNSCGSGIGEAGLDAHKGGIAPIDDQVAALAWQMDLALERNLPITLHCVGAWDRMYELLRTRQNLRFLFHGYKGSPELTREFNKLGAYFSIGPSAIFGSRKPVGPTLAVIPPDRILIETDAPDGLFALMKERNSGKTVSEPAKLVSLCETIAKYPEMPQDNLAEQTSDNACHFFNTNKKIA
jgi:TatD DNase family protein